MNNSIDFQINIGGNATVSLTNIAKQFEVVRGEAKKTESLISRISERLILVNQSFELAGNVSSVFQSLAGAFQAATQEGERFYQGAERAGATTAGRLEKKKEKC